MSPDEELVEAFLEESSENLDQLDLDLVALEANPRDQELLDRIFRTVHTIKGTCGFLGFDHLQDLSHAGEDLLASLRSGELVIDEGIASTLLRFVDELRAVLDTVAGTGGEGDDAHQDMIGTLRGHLPADSPRAQQPPPQPGGPPGGQPASGQPPGGPAPPPVAGQAGAPAETRRPEPGGEESSVRVDVGVLDRLQDQVGELTLARLRMDGLVPSGSSLHAAFRDLTTAARDLQDTIMQVRLQPLGTITARARRIVRDLATQQGKRVRLVVEGEEVTVDKSVVELLRDPLVHLVRNAVDHGIEPPAERQAAGKPAEAELRVAAEVVGGGVNLAVSDDGRGIDAHALVAAAVRSGRLTAEQADAMTESERLQLIFLPGVSTAEVVSAVSGRGVGMDVVRANLERVGGSIDVRSQPGRGSRFLITVPLTLAILPALTVSAGGSWYCLPQIDVLSVLRVAPEEMASRVQDVGSVRLLRHQGGFLPLVDLTEYLHGAGQDDRDTLHVVVLQRLERTYGLVVDAIGDVVEAVVKPLPRLVSGAGAYAGVTVLTDGSPALILESVAPALEAGIQQHVAPETQDVGRHPHTEGMLLTVTAGDEWFAVPLERVQHLSTVQLEDIEHSDHQEVVQHAGGILPLLRLTHMMDLDVGPAGAADDSLTAVVVDSPWGPWGIVVDALDDVADMPSGELEPVENPGVRGRAIVAGRVTEILDVDAITAAAREAGQRRLRDSHA